RAQLDPHGDERCTYPRITQGFHFLDTLAAVHRVQVVSYARMTAQFGAARRQCLEDFDQPIHADGVREGHAIGRLAIEVTAVADVRVAMAQWHGQVARYGGEHSTQRLPQVYVLMGIDVGRLLTDQAAESRQLTRHFLGNRGGVVEG